MLPPTGRGHETGRPSTVIWTRSTPSSSVEVYTSLCECLRERLAGELGEVLADVEEEQRTLLERGVQLQTRRQEGRVLLFELILVRAGEEDLDQVAAGDRVTRHRAEQALLTRRAEEDAVRALRLAARGGL